MQHAAGLLLPAFPPALLCAAPSCLPASLRPLCAPLSSPSSFPPLGGAEVAGSERWAAEADGTPAAPVVHIAEKFRLAYISRDTRVRAKMQRNWEQAQRRELRRSSHAEMLIRDWESEL